MPITEPAKPVCDSTFVYTVKQGDSFNGIAFRYNSNPKQLSKDNPNVTPNSIHEGQQLKVSTYKVSTWNAYQEAMEKYHQDIADEYEQQKSTTQQPAQPKKHSCPKFLDDPIAWFKHRWLSH